MPEVFRMFQIDVRTPETDPLAEELAQHAVLDRWPDAEDVKLVWTRHHQPDLWLLFAIGRTPE